MGPLADPAKMTGSGGGGPSDKHAENSGSSTAKKPGDYSRMPPFQSADPPLNHPHVNNIGDPPKVNANDFERWQIELKSYVCRSYNDLWTIVEKGFYPQNDRDNYTRREVVDGQLNAIALHMIQKVVGEKDFPFIMKET